MKKILVLVFWAISQGLYALNLGEMLRQERVEPSFECAKKIQNYKYYDDVHELIETSRYSSPDVSIICGDFKDSLDEKFFWAISDNFYHSYYDAVFENMDIEDKIILRDISKKMISVRRRCLENLSSNYDWKHEDDYETEQAKCMDATQLYALSKITHLIYKNPKYDGLFEKIFKIDSQKYYQLLNYQSLANKNKTQSGKSDNTEHDQMIKNAHLIISKIIDKAARDELIYENGKLKQMD